MRRSLFVILPALVCGWAGPASAGEPSPSSPRFTAAAKAGGSFHGLFSELESAPQLEVEAGVLLASGVADAGLLVGYQEAPAGGTGKDARLADGSYRWHLDEQIVSVGLVGRYRLTPVAGPLTWYALVSPKFLVMQTTSNGTSGGASLGENRQYDAELALEVGGGAEFEVGPGALIGEAGLTFGGLKGKITGDVAASDAGLSVGYRLRF